MTLGPDNWAIGLCLAAIIAAAVGAAFFCASRAGLSNRWFLVLGMLPSLLIYAANPLHRVYSFHGFLHHGIVYRILGGALPPDNPIFAGAPLLYPWTYHLVAAALSAALGMSPAWAFALINLAALAASLVCMYRVAMLATGDEQSARLAVLLSVYGLGFSSTLHWNRPVLRYFGIFLEFRGVPPFVYFTDINATSCGLACYTLFLWSLLRALAGAPGAPKIRALAAVSVAIAGMGLLYPFHLSAALACVATACAWLVVTRTVRLADTVPVLVVVGATASLLFPYLRSLVAAKATGAEIHLAPSLAYAAANLGRYFALVGPLCLMMVAERTALISLWRQRPIEMRILATAVLVPSLLYVAVAAPFGTEYKYQTLAVVALGVVGSACLAAWVRARPVLAFAVVTAFLVPLGSTILFEGFQAWTVTDAFIEEGSTIRHADPGQESLYRWIRERTARDAIFIDAWRTIPVFGQRRLYVALESRWRPRDGPHTADGWRFSIEQILKGINGYPPSEVDRRMRDAEAFFTADGTVSDERLAGIGERISSQPLYVVARDPGPRRRLDRDPRFRREFDEPAAAVYRWLGSPPTARE